MSTLAPVAASAAMLLLSACATAEGNLQQQLDSTRAELRTLQRENADLARRVDGLTTQLDLLQARQARPSTAAPATAASPASRTPAARPEPAPTVPADLKVVKLEPPRTPPAASPKNGTKPAPKPSRAPAVPTDMPIQEPSPEGAVP